MAGHESTDVPCYRSRDGCDRRAGNATKVALRRRNTIAGATDKEIKIGNIMPYTGSFKEYGAIGRAEAAYFQMINDRGGVNGRKINFIS